MNNKKQLYLILFLSVLFAHKSISKETNSWKISSDHSLHNLASKEIVYSGNASFISGTLMINGDEIRAIKNANGDLTQLNIKGNPVVMKQVENNNVSVLNAKSLKYDYSNKSTTANQNVIFKQQSQSGSFDIKAYSLELSDNQALQLRATGTPIDIIITQPGQDPIKATAEQLNYNGEDETFHLKGDVVMTTQQETIKAHVISYNAAKQLLQMSRTKDNQVELIKN